MIKFNREVWGLMNTRTGKLFAPLKIGGCWFRGLYDSEKSVKMAVKKLHEQIKKLEKYHNLSKEYCEMSYGNDIDTYFGEYVPVKLKGAELDE